jgi:hypothetical protein
MIRHDTVLKRETLHEHNVVINPIMYKPLITITSHIQWLSSTTPSLQALLPMPGHRQSSKKKKSDVKSCRKRRMTNSRTVLGPKTICQWHWQGSCLGDFPVVSFASRGFQQVRWESRNGRKNNNGWV